jgi:hypothetical protein
VRIELEIDPAHDAPGLRPAEREEVLAALERAGRDCSDGAMTVSADPHNIVAVGATVRADNPREALSELRWMTPSWRPACSKSSTSPARFSALDRAH